MHGNTKPKKTAIHILNILCDLSKTHLTLLQEKPAVIHMLPGLQTWDLSDSTSIQDNKQTLHNSVKNLPAVSLCNNNKWPNWRQHTISCYPTCWMLTNDSKGSQWQGVTGPNTFTLMTSGQVHTVSSVQMHCTECCKNPAFIFMFVRDRKNQHEMAICWGYEWALSMSLSGNWGFKTPSTKHWWPHCNCKGNVTYNEQNIVLSQLQNANVLCQVIQH